MARINQNIVIPDNTKLEKSYEFINSEITSINFGNLVQISADYVFAHCDHISELDIPTETIISGSAVFYSLNRLQYLRFGDNITLNGRYLFKDCINLESLAIGHSSNISGDNCFNGLRNLQRIQFAPNTTFSGYYLFSECDSIKEVIIPDNCTINGDFFFRKCPRLERIVIGNNVVIQGKKCFYQCSGVKIITIGNNVTISGLKFMEGCFKNQNVELTVGCDYIGNPIKIPLPIVRINKFQNVKDTLRYESKECSISMERFNDESKVIVLGCGHVFLSEPLIEWLKTKKTCAICRQKI
jgi:hypothetical protein